MPDNNSIVFNFDTVAQRLARFGVVFHPVGMELTHEVTDTDFEKVAKLIKALESQGRTFFNFVLGDLYNAAGQKHARRKEKLEKLFGKRYKDLAKYACVARSFPVAAREYDLPWWLYEELTSVGPRYRQEVLDRYHCGDLNRDMVREWKKSARLAREQAMQSIPPAEDSSSVQMPSDFLHVVRCLDGIENPLTGQPDYRTVVVPNWIWPETVQSFRDKGLYIYYNDRGQLVEPGRSM